MSLTDNNRSDGKQHKSIFPQEALHIVLADVLHLLLGFEGAQVDALADTLHMATGARVFLPGALGHGSSGPAGGSERVCGGWPGW